MSAAVALYGEVELLRSNSGGAASAFTADERDPVIAGHYPGFPVLPGVYLVEAVDRTVRHWAEPTTQVELTAMDRCRFHQPVYPGDRVFVEAAITETEDGLVAKGSLATNRGKIADIRLRYRKEHAK
ncbi:3-hydroxyacyl-ACP dehydratase FabZ family protein [Streptomyces sp. AP-93]|uniref:3-hydroxyacyl-ACP dehydratase FabZ family protein n=1 Tax=Streptomyces sp. AP-93 TaxID=2929048 RepID=UPI001FAEF6DE|nr:MaoC/PaaZ C-terminal domain-containing protein [Streptomyces sp. AP-93]MCJ0871752.1 hypothetical protein [Streptomyces sp. AP-93]